MLFIENDDFSHFLTFFYLYNVQYDQFFRDFIRNSCVDPKIAVDKTVFACYNVCSPRQPEIRDFGGHI